MPLERMLSTPDVSKLLDVPVRTLDNWAYQKIGPPYVKVGRARRYNEADVKAWLEANTVKTKSA